MENIAELLNELKSLANNVLLSLEEEEEQGYRHGYYDALNYVIDWIERELL